MASYELWYNGEEYDSIFVDGNEYTEAWTSINGVPTLVWCKDTGNGGFYNSSDILLLSWYDSGAKADVDYSSLSDTSVSKPSNVLLANGIVYKATKIVIDDTKNIQKLGNFVFSQCRQIKYIVIPSTVKSIGSYAFYLCQSLKELILPDGLERLESNALRTVGGSSTYITTITVPDSVTYIGSSCFGECTYVKDIILPQNLLYLGSSAFYETNVKTINLPPKIEELGSSIFARKTVNGFEQCTSLKKIGNKCFYYCYNTTLEIPDSVEEIGDSAFYYCYQMTKTKIPKNEKLTAIPNECFRECVALEEITIPSNITYIGLRGFYGCTQLANITFETKKNWFYNYGDSETSWRYIDVTNTEGLKYILVEDSSVFKRTDNGMLFKSNSWSVAEITRLDVETNRSGASDSLPVSLGLDTSQAPYYATLPVSLTKIGNNTFNGCKMLIEIVIPESVTSIGFGAFSGCDILSSVTFEDTTNWYLDSSGVAIPSSKLSDPTNAAKTIKEYSNYTWVKR